MAMARVVRADDLVPEPGRSPRFEGHAHGASVSFFVSRGPGAGPPHASYDETFVIQEGSATFVAGDETIEAEPGMIIIVPPDTPHKFTAGPDGLRSVNIHGSPRMIQHDLQEP
jgi:quercetin dioxygenase-like cupin family protein